MASSPSAKNTLELTNSNRVRKHAIMVNRMMMELLFTGIGLAVSNESEKYYLKITE